MAVGKVVQDHGREARLNEHHAGVAADVAGAAGQENVHVGNAFNRNGLGSRGQPARKVSRVRGPGLPRCARNEEKYPAVIASEAWRSMVDEAQAMP